MDRSTMRIPCLLGILCLLATLASACGGQTAGRTDIAPAGLLTGPPPPREAPPSWALPYLAHYAARSLAAPVDLAWVVVPGRLEARLVEALRDQRGAVPLTGVSMFVTPGPGAGAPGRLWCVAVLRGWFHDPLNGPARTTVLVIQSPVLLHTESMTFAGFPQLPATAGAIREWTL